MNAKEGKRRPIKEAAKGGKTVVVKAPRQKHEFVDAVDGSGTMVRFSKDCSIVQFDKRPLWAKGQW